jgi:hypothetical protein
MRGVPRIFPIAKRKRISVISQTCFKLRRFVSYVQNPPPIFRTRPTDAARSEASQVSDVGSIPTGRRSHRGTPAHSRWHPKTERLCEEVSKAGPVVSTGSVSFPSSFSVSRKLGCHKIGKIIDTEGDARSSFLTPPCVSWGSSPVGFSTHRAVLVLNASKLKVTLGIENEREYGAGPRNWLDDGEAIRSY